MNDCVLVVVVVVVEVIFALPKMSTRADALARLVVGISRRLARRRPAPPFNSQDFGTSRWQLSKNTLMMYIIEVNAGGRGTGMRLTNEKVAENKARVVEAAARLFREKGFEGVAVADLMHAAGLTHGGFYNHFESKDELAAQACTQIFEGPVAAMERIAAIESASGRTAALDGAVLDPQPTGT
jgi:hypothetical protein